MMTVSSDVSSDPVPGSREAVLARTAELMPVLRRGEMPEDILAKGAALVELMKLRPWRYEPALHPEEDEDPGAPAGSFERWQKGRLPYGRSRAFQILHITERIQARIVIGRHVCFDALLAISDAPAERHAELLDLAEAGMPARALRRLIAGKAPEPDIEEVQERQLRTAERYIEKWPLALVRKLVAAGQARLAAEGKSTIVDEPAPPESAHKPPPKPEPQPQPEPAPRTDLDTDALCADYDPPPCPVHGVNV